MFTRITAFSCLALLFSGALALVMSSQEPAAARDGDGRPNPAGTWVQTTHGTGQKALVTVSLTDPDGREFALVTDDFQGTPNFLGLFPSAVDRSPFRGVLASTGPRSGDFTTLAYATDADGGIVYIMSVSGSAVFTSPDHVVATATLGIWAPDQDPLGGGSPAYLCVPFEYSLDRVELVDPCSP